MSRQLGNCKSVPCGERFNLIGGRSQSASCYSIRSVSLRAVMIEMADSADTAPAARNLAGIEPKKTKSVTIKTGTKPVRPRTSEMVVNAIRSLKERGASSFQGIKIILPRITRLIVKSCHSSSRSI